MKQDVLERWNCLEKGKHTIIAGNGSLQRDQGIVAMKCRKRMQCNVRGCLKKKCLVPLFVLCIIVPSALQILILNVSLSLPRYFSLSSLPEPSCEQPGPPFLLENSAFCIGVCRSECFPRVAHLCISSSEVKYCKAKEEEDQITSTQRIYPSLGQKDLVVPKGSRMPKFMRFHGERLTLPVIHSVCRQEKNGIPGLSLVADQRYLPYRRPNPHHEAEKLIPAILFTQRSELSDYTFYWFSTAKEVSEWGKGLLEAFNMQNKVKYVDFSERENGTVCFQDAIVFSAGTGLYYIPDQDTNDWLRQHVLQFCSIPIVNASWPPKKVAILDRSNGSRQLQNKFMVASILSQMLGIHVRQGFSGVGSFCDQVRAVAEEDLIVVPHGSQNVNLIFARKGAVVIEVFPFLFYTTALRNYTHAAQLHLYPLLGDIPNNNFLIRLLSVIGWDSCFEKLKWCKNYSRRQCIHADIEELKNLLLQIKEDSSKWRN